MKEEIAKSLLKIEAVHLRPDQPYLWTSGIKSPIYCDNRLTMSYPEVRKQIAEGFVKLIQTHYPQTEVIAGIATGGIPHAAWVADRLQLPMIYIRSSSKSHGKQNRIEGKLTAGDKVLVIEDLISTGKSSISGAQAVREAGGSVEGVIAILDYEFDMARKAFAEAGFPYQSLSDYSTLISVAQKEGKIREDQIELLMAWRKNPFNYSLV